MAHYCGQVLFSLVPVIVISLASSECGTDGRMVLPIGLFASSDVLRTADSLPAAELAIQQINDDNNILPGYCLQQRVFSSECTIESAAHDTFTFLNLDSTTAHSSNVSTSEGASLFIVGGGCPDRTVGVAVVTEFLFPLEIDYTPPREDHRESVYHLMPLLGYSFLATINFMDTIGARHFTWFVEYAEEFTEYDDPHQLWDISHWIDDHVEGIILCPLDLCHDEIGVQTHLMNVSETVYFLEAHADIMRETACQAVKHGAVYPNKLWVLHGMEGGAWWEWELDTPTECSNEEVKKFLDKAITIVPLFDGEMKGSAPTVGEELTKAYQNLQNMSRRLLYVHEPLIYDAVWLTAEALERSLPILNDSNLTLNSSQQNQAVKEVVQNTLNSSIFSGLTGSIEFIDSFRSAERFKVLQYQLLPSGELTLVPVANLTLDPASPHANIEFLGGYNLVALFPDGVPKPPQTIIRVVPWIAFGLILFLSVSGVVFASICIVMVLVLWNRREMKMSSPRLNLAIAIGGIVWYTSASVITVPNSALDVVTVLCEIRQWGWNIGATLFFVPLLLKNWRVYYIFHNPTKRKIVLKDWKLLLALVIFLIVDVTLLTIFTSIPATRLTGQLESFGPFEKQLDCYSNASYIAFGILAGYRTILCIIGCVLAFQNRNVNIPELRESRQVGLATYAFLFTVVFEVAIVFAVQNSVIRAILVSLEMQLAATLFLLILFVPKIYRAIKGGTNQSDTSGNTESDLSTTMSSGIETLQRCTLAAMQREIEALKLELKKYQKSAGSKTVNNCNGVAIALQTEDC